MTEIIQAAAPAEIDEARKLFREYEAWLGFDLCFQGFEQEMRELPGKYAPPEGRLFLALVGGKTAGCGALRKLSDGICEMKRVFVRDAFKGAGVGNMIIEKLISSARGIGYREMRLDTFPPKMGKAVRLYESHGFREIPPYYDNPHEGVMYLSLEL